MGGFFQSSELARKDKYTCGGNIHDAYKTDADYLAYIDYIKDVTPPALQDWRTDVRGRKIGLDGRASVKQPDIELPYTEEHIMEIIKCRDDPLYFSRYFTIVNKDEGRQRIKLWDFQYHLVRCMVENRFSCVLTPRQVGKTTTASILLLWYAMFHPDYQIGILSYKEKGAKDVMNRVKLAYQELPNWLKLGIVTWNTLEIEFENGSKIFGEATTEDSFTGKSLNLLYFDEVAKVSPNIFEHLYNSIYPTISSGKTTKLIMTSTPKGLNHFFSLCSEADRGINGYAYFRLFWNEVPGRDDEWRAITEAKLGKRGFAQEYEAEFIGSGDTLIDAGHLRKMARQKPVLESEHVRVYEEWQEGHAYCAGIDVSKGVGLDYHCVQVFDITERPVKQVAVFHSNDMAPTDFAVSANAFLKMFKSPPLMIENNEYGGVVANSMFWDLEYENIYWSSHTEPGIRTTHKLKWTMLMFMKELIEADQLIVNDEQTIYELGTFIRKKTSFCADEGSNDDLVMSMALGLHIFRTEWGTGENITRLVSSPKSSAAEEEIDTFFLSSSYEQARKDNMMSAITTDDIRALSK